MKKTALVLLASTTLATTPLQAAIAQDQGGDDNAGSPSAGDIIVTARRVEERLQDVPISMTVFNQKALDRQNVFSAKDLATYTPSLTANSRYGADFASFAIRGFTQEARTTTSVGVYFADAVVPRSSPLSASGDGAGPGHLFDLQSVQVLKGPQGTLFGRNTTGGAVVLVPNRPTYDFEGYVEASAGNYDMKRVQAVLNLPVSESFRLRFGVDTQERDGYLRNISGVGPRDFADVGYVAARVSAVADLSDNVENYTVISYTRSKTNGAASRTTDCYASSAAGVATNGPNGYSCQQIQRERDAGDLTVTNALPWAYQKLETWQIVNSLKWQVSDNLTIKNINSYGQIIQDQAIDLFGVWVPLGNTLRVPTSTAPYFRTVNVPSQYVGKGWGSDTSISPPGLHSGQQETFTQELQFQGTNFGSNLTWQAGLYYERSLPLGWAGSQSMNGVLCDSEAEWAEFACTDASAVTGAATATGSRNFNVGRVAFRNMAAYAQGSYKLTSALTLDAGIRYTWDKTMGSSTNMVASYAAATGWNTPTFTCTNPALTYGGSPATCLERYSQSSKAPTWMIGLNYKIMPDIMVCAKYARGYRQGSVSPLAAVGFKTYEPERVDVYEGGIKTSWHGAMPGSFNLSGFYNDFQDMQLQVSFVDTNGIAPNLPSGPAVVNAGKARIWGLEAEASISPFEGLTLQASYAYLNTKLLKFIAPDLSTQPVGGYNLVASTPVEGSRLQFTPNHKLSVTANYTLPLPDSVGQVSLGATYVYTGSVFYGRDASLPNRVYSVFAPSDPNYDTQVAPSYDLVNFNLNWEKPFDAPVDLQVFVTNAFDKRYYEARSLSGSRGFTSRYYGDPRMYGARVRYTF
ncbi:TonB-dependent receptor [Sphingomonas sp. LH128]|uniref:TonB-dependent receptor n=1 Tax=Sphingomonas sp. LH128 TaxID=473781 RepID=UPI00027C96E5|nr:TonB-dependent receptor [Sphingomonas sp. LH128]EJU14743.1 TonB-dependent receptor [Sphingomonas sp. LH128]